MSNRARSLCAVDIYVVNDVSVNRNVSWYCDKVNTKLRSNKFCSICIPFPQETDFFFVLKIFVVRNSLDNRKYFILNIPSKIQYGTENRVRWIVIYV